MQPSRNARERICPTLGGARARAQRGFVTRRVPRRTTHYNAHMWRPITPVGSFRTHVIVRAHGSSERAQPVYTCAAASWVAGRRFVVWALLLLVAMRYRAC